MKRNTESLLGTEEIEEDGSVTVTLYFTSPEGREAYHKALVAVRDRYENQFDGGKVDKHWEALNALQNVI